MKRVKFGRRMLGSFKLGTSCGGKFLDLRGRQQISHKNNGGVQSHMGSRQEARGSRRSHRFAAVMSLVRRIARHGAAALHAPLVLAGSGHAISELQTQQGEHRYGDK